MGADDRDVQATIIDVLRRRTPDGAPIAAETRMVQDLGLDSIAVMNFVMDLEDRFDLSIPLDRIAEVETVGDLTAAIKTLLETRP